jgi:hypothetical protein
MADSTTRTASCPRLAAQDRHGPKESVPLALSTFAPRRGWAGGLAIHGHLTARAMKSAI